MKLRLTRVVPEEGGATTFAFQALQPLSWAAGQSIRLEIPRRSYGVDERRFTISSAPHEKYVHITTRPSDSEFKQNLFSLQPDSLVDAYSVDGSFVWDDSITDPVFFAGGIGITPFRAMLAQRIFEQKLPKAVLFYGSSSGFVFQEQLNSWQKKYPTLTIHYHNQRFTPDFLTARLSNFQDRVVYLSGPSAMVDTLTATLQTIGHPQHLLKRDHFTGNVSE